MTSEAKLEVVYAALARGCTGRVSRAPDLPLELSTDFGRIISRPPALVLEPFHREDVLTALQIAAEHDLPVTTRGAGHSQCGQGLGAGLVLDMRGLARVQAVRSDDVLVEADAGASWRRIVDSTFASGLLPIGLTHVLDTTIGGTLSVGGVGAEAFRVGPQVDNVRFVDVAKFDGKIDRCSADENRELFDAVRAGLGQCGVMVHAGYPLRTCKPRVRTQFLGYNDVDAFMADVETVCRDTRAEYVCGAVTLRAEPFDRWAIVERPPTTPRTLLLILGREYEDGHTPDSHAIAGGLNWDVDLGHQDSPLWNEQGLPGHFFFNVYVPPPGSIDADPTTSHPWVDLMFARQTARAALTELLSPTGTSERHQNALIFIRRRANPAPLLADPGSQSQQLVWGIGMFPSAHPSARDATLRSMSQYAERWSAAGGKRYLSGYVPLPDPGSWSQHYGAAWPRFQDLKRRFDPKHLLNPGFVHFGD